MGIWKISRGAPGGGYCGGYCGDVECGELGNDEGRDIYWGICIDEYLGLIELRFDLQLL